MKLNSDEGRFEGNSAAGGIARGTDMPDYNDKGLDASEQLLEALAGLKQLREDGALDDAEFAAAKALILEPQSPDSSGSARGQSRAKIAAGAAAVAVTVILIGLGLKFGTGRDAAPVEERRSSTSSVSTEQGANLEVAAKLACAEARWDAPGDRVDLLSASAMAITQRTPGLSFEEVFGAASLYCSDLVEAGPGGTSRSPTTGQPAPSFEERRSLQIQECTAQRDWTWANGHCVYDPFTQY